MEAASKQKDQKEVELRRGDCAVLDTKVDHVNLAYILSGQPTRRPPSRPLSSRQKQQKRWPKRLPSLQALIPRKRERTGWSRTSQLTNELTSAARRFHLSETVAAVRCTCCRTVLCMWSFGASLVAQQLAQRPDGHNAFIHKFLHNFVRAAAILESSNVTVIRLDDLIVAKLECQLHLFEKPKGGLFACLELRKPADFNWSSKFLHFLPLLFALSNPLCPSLFQYIFTLTNRHVFVPRQ